MPIPSSSAYTHRFIDAGEAPIHIAEAPTGQKPLILLHGIGMDWRVWQGVSRRLRGLLLDGRQVPRTGYGVLRAGERVGEVTSGNFSPTLERGIALAFVRPDVDVGQVVDVDVRGRPVAAAVVKPPFVHK